MAKGKKTGGRVAGTPNKDNQSLLEKCKGRGVDLFDEFLKIITDENEEKGLRFAALKEAAQYVLPKRKAIEVSATISPELAEAAENIQELSKSEQIKLLKDQLKELEK